MNHMIDCDPGDSPFSPYYHEQPETGLCCYCYSEREITEMLEIDEGYVCTACMTEKQYNEFIYGN